MSVGIAQRGFQFGHARIRRRLLRRRGFLGAKRLDFLLFFLQGCQIRFIQLFLLLKLRLHAVQFLLQRLFLRGEFLLARGQLLLQRGRALLEFLEIRRRLL